MSSQTTPPKIREKYSPKLFVGREDKVQEALKRIELLRQGSERRRVSVYLGETAIGKTWLLKTIEHKLSQPTYADKYITHWFNLPLQSEINGFDEVQETRKVMLRFANEALRQQMPEETLAGLTLPGLSRRIMEEITRILTAGKWLVLFLDSVFEAPWRFLELFEEYLLGPLAIKPEVIILMSGRGRLFPWATPELRFTSEEDEIKLQKFELPQTEEQLKRAESDLGDLLKYSELLHQYSNGVPGISYWLAEDQEFREWLAKDKESRETTKPGTFRQIMLALLQPLGVENQEHLLKYFEALCVLRSFDDDRIMAMVQAHPDLHQELSQDDLYKRTVEIRRQLLYESLATYNEAKSVYELDKSLKTLAIAHLKQNNYPLWLTLHKTALELYEDWAKKYPRTASLWLDEAAYHQSELPSKNSPQTS
ncbi:hypothetical protein GC175_17645 [bacterium]|nr:hypothetical protein [bacterium]